MARNFDGVNDVIISTRGDTGFLGALSIVCWANIETGSNYRHFCGKHAGAGGTNNPFDFRTDNQTTPVMTIAESTASANRIWVGPVVTLNSWVHYGVTRADGLIETAPLFYADGVQTTGTTGDSNF